jgi:hypothetical protein
MVLFLTVNFILDIMNDEKISEVDLGYLGGEILHILQWPHGVEPYETGKMYFASQHKGDCPNPQMRVFGIGHFISPEDIDLSESVYYLFVDGVEKSEKGPILKGKLRQYEDRYDKEDLDSVEFLINNPFSETERDWKTVICA